MTTSSELILELGILLSIASAVCAHLVSGRDGWSDSKMYLSNLSTRASQTLVLSESP